MGYHTEFSGHVDVVPPLSAEEIAYLQVFAGTRRMARKSGPYYAVDDGNFGQSNREDVIDYNRPPAGQPGLWCQWVPSEDGTRIEWDGGEKFYDSAEWMEYLIEHFLKDGCAAIGKVPGIIGGHTLNGRILAQGEEVRDRWELVVENNKVCVENLR
jgi:hypothetical protein